MINVDQSDHDFDDLPDDFFDDIVEPNQVANTQRTAFIDLTGESSDDEFGDLPDDFFDEVPETILSPPTPEPKNFNSLPIEVQSHIIAYAISKPSDPDWGNDFEDEYTGYDGSDMPEQEQVTLCDRRTARRLARVSSAFLDQVIYACRRRITAMDITFELIEDEPPKEVIEDDPVCEYFMVEQRLKSRGIDPEEVYPENWPDHNPWCCDHCGRLCFYSYELERYGSNLKKLKAEMKRLPLFVAGLESAQDRLELMRTIQKSKVDVGGPTDKAADKLSIAKSAKGVPAPRYFSYKLKR